MKKIDNKNIDLYDHPEIYYKDNYSLKTDDYPNARDADQFSMAIPLHNKMTADDYAYVVDKLKNIHP